MSTCWWRQRKCEGIIVVIRSHPLWTLNVCTECYGNTLPHHLRYQSKPKLWTVMWPWSCSNKINSSLFRIWTKTIHALYILLLEQVEFSCLSKRMTCSQRVVLTLNLNTDPRLILSNDDSDKVVFKQGGVILPWNTRWQEGCKYFDSLQPCKKYVIRGLLKLQDS